MRRSDHRFAVKKAAEAQMHLEVFTDAVLSDLLD
jgi:hypothetical protein